MHEQMHSLQMYLVHGFIHGAFATAIETNAYGKRETLGSSSMGCWSLYPSHQQCYVETLGFALLLIAGSPTDFPY